MTYRMINKVCYMAAMSSIVVGTGIGMTAIWLDNVLPIDFTTKSLATTTLLFVASTLGALITRLLVVRGA